MIDKGDLIGRVDTDRWSPLHFLRDISWDQHG